MNIPNQFPRTRLRITSCGRLGRGRAVDGGFVVEAIEITAGVLEVLDPFLGLLLSSVGHPTLQLDLLLVRTSAIIMWQSNVPFPMLLEGLST